MKHLFLYPPGNRLDERREAGRRVRQIGLQEPVECKERFVVEANEINLVQDRTGLVEAIGGGFAWKRGVVLPA